MSPPGMLEDHALRAVYALADVPPEQRDMETLLNIRMALSTVIARAMEAQNAVKAAE